MDEGRVEAESGAGADPESAAALARDWARLCPELDTWPYQIYASGSQLTKALTRALGPTFARSGIKGGDYELLSTIRRKGPPYEVMPSQLSGQMRLGSGALTRRLDRLEGTGYLQRLPHDRDRRAIIVQLTPAGVEVVDSTAEQIVEILAAILGPVRDRTPKFQRIVADVLDGLAPPAS